MPHPIDIFRVGRHTAMSGATLDFSAADLEATAAAYDPALHEAPLVVGHPTADAPAYGWVSTLARAAAILRATPAQVDPAFAELVAAGRFKKVSASFYLPDSGANPVPGVYYLRHVGFLGAQPPAVKGLRQVAFSDAPGEAGIVTLEFADTWSERANAGLWRRLREFLIAQFGLEKADDVIPSYSVEDLEDAARQPPAADAPAQPQPAFSEGHMPSDSTAKGAPSADDLAAREQAITDREAAADAREQRLRDAEAATRRKAHTAFAEQLVEQGRLLPRDQDGLVAFMDGQAADATLAFGEGEAAFKGTSLDWLKDFLGRLPIQVDFVERSAPMRDGQTHAAGFRAPDGVQVDPERLDLHTRALAYQEAHQGVSYTDAVILVSQGV